MRRLSGDERVPDEDVLPIGVTRPGCRLMRSGSEGGAMMAQFDRPRVFSRRSMLRYGAGGMAALGALVLAACGQSPAAAPAANPAKPADSKPAESKPAD